MMPIIGILLLCILVCLLQASYHYEWGTLPTEVGAYWLAGLTGPTQRSKSEYSSRWISVQLKCIVHVAQLVLGAEDGQVIQHGGWSTTITGHARDELALLDVALCTRPSVSRRRPRRYCSKYLGR